MDVKKKSSATTASGERNTGTAKSSKSKKAKAKEEEEKRLEEEARLKAEQEAREAKERELKEDEARKKRKKEIDEIKNRELTGFYDIMTDIRLKLESYHKKRRDNLSWERYMKCDGSPNPSINGEINTFLTLCKEDMDSQDLKNSFNIIDLALKLIDELDFLIDDHPEDESEQLQELRLKLIEQYKKTIRDLENMILNKTDEIGHSILLEASNNIDPESLNFSYSDGSENLYYCIWANLSHNPRIKDFIFPSKNLQFNLPRPLTLAHFAFSTVFMNFDLFSPRSKTFSCRTKCEKFDFDPVPEIKSSDDIKEEKKNSDEVKDSFDDDLPPELRAIMEKSSTNRDKEENEDSTEDRKELTEDVTIVKEETPKIEEKNTISEEELAIMQELSDNFVVDLRNYYPLGHIIHLKISNIPPQPKKIKQWVITQMDHTENLIPYLYPTDSTLVQNSWTEYWNRKQEQEPGSLSLINEDEAADISKNKKIDMNLTIKSNDVLESTIGADDTIVSDSNKQFLKSFLTKTNEQLVKAMKNEGPIHMNYKIPGEFFFAEAPLLARWDEKRQQWRTDQILDFKYNEEQREIHFKTYNFSPYCLLQDRHVHMPFQLWRMAPRESVNNCMITLETCNFEINIEIKLNKLRVYMPIRKPLPAEEESRKQSKKHSIASTSKNKIEIQRLDYEIQNPNPNFVKATEPIANKWFSLREFKKVLRSIGLNIFPEPDSEKFVTLTNKDKKLEWLVHRNLALCSNLLSFAYSKWTTEIEDVSKIVLNYQLHTTDSEPNQDLYKSLLCHGDVFSLNDTLEYSDEFNHNITEGTQEHADIYHVCLEEICKHDQSLVDLRVRQIDPLYYETCLQFLDSVRFIVYS